MIPLSSMSSSLPPWSVRCSQPCPCSLGRSILCHGADICVIYEHCYLSIGLLQFWVSKVAWALVPENFALWVNKDARRMLLAVGQGPGKGLMGRMSCFLPFLELLSFISTFHCGTAIQREGLTWGQNPSVLILFFTGPQWTPDLTGVLWTLAICHRWFSTGEWALEHGVSVW